MTTTMREGDPECNEEAITAIAELLREEVDRRIGLSDSAHPAARLGNSGDHPTNGRHEGRVAVLAVGAGAVWLRQSSPDTVLRIARVSI